MTSAIVGRRITVRRGERTLLHDVSLAVEWGEVVALVGPNGAGKSTLLSCLAGDIDPDAGEVILQERQLANVPLEERARIRAVLPQQTVLQFGFTARDVVAMGRAPLPPSSREDDEASVSNALAETEMLGMASRSFPRLSGGEQHRVSVARILAQEAPLLLLDEPTASLDIRHQHLVMETARAVANQGGAILAVLHDLNLALSHVDRIGVLHCGELVACDTPTCVANEELLSRVFDYPIAVENRDGTPLIVPQRRYARVEEQA